MAHGNKQMLLTILIFALGNPQPDLCINKPVGLVILVIEYTFHPAECALTDL